MDANTTQKPYAESCVENGPPILEVLRRLLPGSAHVLEIGSGTGQHAVMFAGALGSLSWQPSDRSEMHPGMLMWIEEAGLPSLLSPLALDVLEDAWPIEGFDAVFSANTAHIMPKSAVMAMFAGVAKLLPEGAPFLLYGPFMYNGRHTSESNARFDLWLKSVEPCRGVRDVTWLQEMAEPLGMRLDEDVAMPANNRILVWRKDG